MDKLLKDLASDISDCIKFKSYEQPAKQGMPFGEDAARCLEHFLALAKKFGFETKNYDNFAGEVTFGEGAPFAILAHLDVVPAGSGWKKDPFGGEIDFGAKRVWGRGAMDDKGPAVIVLHAMKALKDEGFKPKKKIKLILGCNEESGWRCMDYYSSHAQMPETGFSPDADFPVIYAEKGILHVVLKFRDGGVCKDIRGGERANMVCDYCEAKADYDVEKLKKYGLSYQDGKIISRGKSAHGSTPELGVNAIKPVLQYLGLNDMSDMLFGDGFGFADFEDETGKLTFSPDIIEKEGEYIKVTCDIRYPATYKKEDVTERFIRAGVEFEIEHWQAPLYNDKNCFLIKTLCGVYNEVTGKNVSPIAIGGGTYARALKCGAAFGPEEAGEESTIHKPNEYITFEKIEKCFKIYKLAIERLTEND